MNCHKIIIKYFVIAGVISICFNSCENDMIIDSELPKPENKLVLHSTISSFTPPFLSPFKVQVWNSVAILDTTNIKQITDAQVFWYEDGKIKDTLLFNDEINGYTTSDFYFPSTGKTYGIEVNKQGFRSLSASNYVPNKVKIKAVELTNLAGIDTEGLAYSSINLSFQDPEEEQNFYELIITDVSNENAKYRLWTNDKIITEESYYPSLLSFEKKKPDRLLFNDKQIRINKTLVLYFTPEQVIDKGQLKIRYSIVDVYLRSVSEEYYKYYTTYIQHQYNQKGDFFYGLGEPMNVFSNVTGGYGIFAGFQNEAVTCIIDSIKVN